MNASVKRKIRKIFSPFQSIGLKNKNFSIISNNCWGGIVYDIFGLKYLSPTIGCFFFSEDYIKFISNLKYYLSIECKPLEKKNSKYKKYLEENLNNHWILGIIDDVEIIFVHYSNINEAIDKWNRRRKRVNFTNILIKYNDQNLFKKEDYFKFNDLKFKNKIFFTANKELCDEEYTYYISSKENYVVDDIKSSFKRVNIKKVLNSMKKE